MNLGKLLAAGKSIMGGRREISYRVSDHVYLPKFISAKNPFAPTSKAEPSPQAIATPAKKEAVPEGKKAKKLPTFSVIRRLPRSSIRKFNPLLFWRHATPKAQQKLQGPMQVELSLDRVKVVHNDLSDADVEIVPIKSRTAPAELEAAEPAFTSANGEDSWGRLGAKIFGVKTV